MRPAPHNFRKKYNLAFKLKVLNTYRHLLNYTKTGLIFGVTRDKMYVDGVKIKI